MQQKDYKTIKKISLCVMCCLQQFFLKLKYTSLATLSNIFQEFQVIYEVLNTVLIQWQSHSKLCALKYYTKIKKNLTHYCNTMCVVFMHGWLVQVKLYGAWFLEAAQYQLVETSVSAWEITKTSWLWIEQAAE